MGGALQVYAILRGKKLIENRGFAIPRGWYAIHCGSQMITDERRERTLQVWPDAPAEEDLPHGVIAGFFHIEEHRLPTDCQPYVFARGPICNIISKAVELPQPVRCRGDRGLWRIRKDVKEDIRRQLSEVNVSVRQFDLTPVVGTVCH